MQGCSGAVQLVNNDLKLKYLSINIELYNMDIIVYIIYHQLSGNFLYQLRVMIKL